jgi:hypothetical protein
MTNKEYLEVLRAFVVTTGDEAEDKRLMEESFDEDFADYLHDDVDDEDLK